MAIPNTKHYPTYELKEIPVTDEMERAFGVRPKKAVLGLDLFCVFESEDDVRNMTPDQVLLATITGRTHPHARFISHQASLRRGTRSGCLPCNQARA